MIVFIATVAGKHLHVRSTTSTTTACPQSASCHTLQELLQHSSHYFLSHTTITFQSGYHEVNYSYNALVRNVRNITLLGDVHDHSVIQCTGAFGLSFVNVINLTISNLNFYLCGALIPKQYRPTMYAAKLLQTVNYTATLYFLQVSNVKISSIEIHNSTGVGMLGVNALVSISQTTLTSNVPNCIFAFTDSSTFPTLLFTTKLTITDSLLKLGSPPETYFGYASGLSMVFTQTTYTVVVTISNVTTYSNKGHSSGNMLLMLDKCSYQCTSVKVYNVTSTRAVGDGMGWIFKNINGVICNQSCDMTSTNAQISQSQFSNNNGNGIYIINQQPDQKLMINFRIESTTFTDNTGDALHCAHINNIYLIDTNFTQNLKTAIFAVETKLIFYGNTTVTLNTGYWGAVSLIGGTTYFYGSSNFIGNKGKVTGAILATGSILAFVGNTHIFADNKGKKGGAIYIAKNSRIVFLGKSTQAYFKKNQALRAGGAIFVEDSIVSVIPLASLIFSNNTGYNGGALALIGNSHITLQAPIQVQFLQNHAMHYGGAIYLNDYSVEIFNKGKLPNCFFEVKGILFDITSPFPLQKLGALTLEKNTAQQAGSILYGGWVDLCYAKTDSIYSYYGTEVFDQIFTKHNDNDDLSVVSSNPTRVCICVNSTQNCNITQYNFTAYPGETFQIPAVAVGQRFGTVPFTVQSRFISNSKATQHMEALQYTQMVRRNCTNLTYSIRSSNKFETIQLQVDKFNIPESSLIDDALIFHPHLTTSMYAQFTDLQMHITLLPCPLGFAFEEHLMTCSCASKLYQYNIACNINTRKVSRPISFWISAKNVDNNSNVTIVHRYCPFDYCKPDSFDLDLEYPDEQCAFHRSGILCGACQNNLSHVFGTSACRECSSLWAVLWVPLIALAGVALVVLLIVLNLTVSVGTINGLIFYANIVRANHATFFPPNTTNSFLSWFI